MSKNTNRIDNGRQFEALFNHATIGIVVTNKAGVVNVGPVAMGTPPVETLYQLIVPGFPPTIDAVKVAVFPVQIVIGATLIIPTTGGAAKTFTVIEFVIVQQPHWLPVTVQLYVVVTAGEAIGFEQVVQLSPKAGVHA